MTPFLSLRDPVHGFVRADPLEAALVATRPMQRLRWIHQLGMMFFVFPGAELDSNYSGNTVSLLAAVILYLLAVGPVRGFALTLGISTVIDTIAS